MYNVQCTMYNEGVCLRQTDFKCYRQALDFVEWSGFALKQRGATGVAYGETHQRSPYSAGTGFCRSKRAAGRTHIILIMCHAELVEASLPRSGKAERSSAILFACGAMAAHEVHITLASELPLIHRKRSPCLSCRFGRRLVCCHRQRRPKGEGFAIAQHRILSEHWEDPSTSSG